MVGRAVAAPSISPGATFFAWLPFAAMATSANAT